MSLLSSTRTPRCFSCLWRALDVNTPSLFNPVQIQVRGKKKLPRCTTITVRLLENVKAYGGKGTILAIAPARMRNHLYPRSQAAYMTVAEVKKAVEDELVMERDASFGLAKAVEVQKEREVVYDMKMITPQRTRALLNEILPEELEFQRKPISQDASADMAFIFGSVSSLDILTDITAQLAKKAKDDEYEDAGKVVMSAHDIQISTEGLAPNVAEAEKIKALGAFNVTINIKNAEPLERRIKVIPLKTQN